jgi:transcriptional regulator with XRE-family HTH domain
MFKISLKAARELSGYTVEEVAVICGVTVDVYSKIETDPSQTQLSLVHKIVTAYGVPLDIIYPGTDTGCIKHNQSQVITQIIF